MWKGTWSTNNGNTWSDTVYTAKTRVGLSRLLAKIIDGNLTGYHDKGKACLWAPGSDIRAEAPDDIAYRVWTDNKWHRYD